MAMPMRTSLLYQTQSAPEATDDFTAVIVEMLKTEQDERADARAVRELVNVPPSDQRKVPTLVAKPGRKTESNALASSTASPGGGTPLEIANSWQITSCASLPAPGDEKSTEHSNPLDSGDS